MGGVASKYFFYDRMVEVENSDSSAGLSLWNTRFVQIVFIVLEGCILASFVYPQSRLICSVKPVQRRAFLYNSDLAQHATPF